MKICVIGYEGSGKSTLSTTLGEIYQINTLFLDTVKYQENKVLSNEEIEEEIKLFLNINKDWVIDGNYFLIDQKRFKEADQIIFLNFNRFYCYKKAKERSKKLLKTDLKTNPRIASFDSSFKKWILFKSRKKKYRLNYIHVINQYKDKVVEIKNIKALNTYLESLTK